MIETVLIADTLPLGRTLANELGLSRRTTRIVSKPDQLRGWSLDADVRIIDKTNNMSVRMRQQIDHHLSLCTMASRHAKGTALTELLNANDPPPPLGSIVEDATGVEWLHAPAVHGGSYWLRQDALDGDPESWTKVAGNYGPVKLKEPAGVGDTNDLVSWLREQIAEDRRLALACGGDEALSWSPTDPHLEDAYLTAYARHIVRHDPRAALAQCDAHTAILDLHFVRSDGRDLCNEDSDPYPCGTVRALGLAHQHQPGYLEDWRWRP